MSQKYDHQAIEKKWQERWATAGAFATPDKKEGAENFYFLTEFPYPSGNLHVGHWYAFSVPDIFARYMRMRGYNVLYPIGFDAFGLPAENAAIKNKLNPREWTFKNIEYMRGQLRSMGASFDWSREVITASPEYYKWTQWIFLQFYKKGLVYRKETAVNWCPQDKTVLANEQVVDGHCERCGAEVMRRMLPQWNIKITEYADRLIDDLEPLDWPRQIKDAQINWIGRSEGAEIDFTLTSGEKLTVFTTRPDTLYGATYMVVAPEHPLVEKYKDAEVAAYVAAASKKTEIERGAAKEKTGIELKGVKAINPANKEELPIYVADYVLWGYGTGAIMAVPAHDERDFEFAKKFNIPIKEVVVANIVDRRNPPVPGKKIVERQNVHAIVCDPKTGKYLALKWKKFDWTTFPMGGVEEGENIEEAARREVKEETGYTNLKLLRVLPDTVRAEYFAAHKDQNRVSYTKAAVFELAGDERDEISAEESEGHDIIWLDASELDYAHMTHAEIEEWKAQIEGRSVSFGPGVLINSGEFSGLDSEAAKQKITEFVGGKMVKTYRLRDWVVSRQRYWGVPIPMAHCSKCGYQPVNENSLPVELPEVDDYLPRDDGKSPLAKATEWVQTTCDACGGPAERETDTLDTFVDSSWYFNRYTDPKNDREFAAKEKLQNWLPVDLYSGGSEHTTMHVLYSRFWHKAMHDLGLVADPEPYLRRMNRGLIMGPDGQKMSKSKGNVVDPDEAVRQLGADTVRMYLAFIGPYNEVGAYPWAPGGAVGVRRFLDKVWKLAPGDGQLDADTELLLNQTIKKVGDDIASLKMNTCVSALMILLNALERLPVVPHEVYKIFLQLLAPFAPHICHELAERAGYERAVWEAWPAVDASKLTQTSATIAVQVNGRVRGTIVLSMDASEEEALGAGREQVAKWLEGKVVEKALYIPGKIVNFVVS